MRSVHTSGRDVDEIQLDRSTTTIKSIKPKTNETNTKCEIAPLACEHILRNVTRDTIVIVNFNQIDGRTHRYNLSIHGIC